VTTLLFIIVVIVIDGRYYIVIIFGASVGVPEGKKKLMANVIIIIF